jgi:hypothetical protein
MEETPRTKVQNYIKENITGGKDPLFHNLPDVNDRIKVVDPMLLRQELVGQTEGKITRNDFVQLQRRVVELSVKKDFLISFNEAHKIGPTLVLVHEAGSFDGAVTRIKDSGKFGGGDPMLLSNFESLTI